MLSKKANQNLKGTVKKKVNLYYFFIGEEILN